MTFRELERQYIEHNHEHDCDCQDCRDYRELVEIIESMSVIRLFEALTK